MQSLLIRRGTVAAVVAAFLVTAAGAQDRPSRPKLQDRDPFINQQQLKTTSPSPTRIHPVTPQSEPQGQPHATIPTRPNVDTVAVQAPLVKVTGIIQSQGKKSAILNVGQASRIVAVGERVADYQVTSISHDGVVFTYSGQKFEVPMESEF